MTDKVKLAREFAIAAHADQQYGSRPYVHHLDAVAAIAKSFGEKFEVVAYLHDVVEDTSVTLDQIEAVFGAEVASSVALVTDEPGESRNTRKVKTNAKLAKTSDVIALVVKAADRLANLRECQKQQGSSLLFMYRREHFAFRSAVHRPGLCDFIWSQIDRIIEAGTNDSE